MRRYINAGFGDLIGPAQFDLFRGVGLQGVRRDVTQADLSVFAAEFADGPGASFSPLFVVNGGKMGLDAIETIATARDMAQWIHWLQLPNAAIEIGNEPDIATAQWSAHPEDFARLVNSAAQAIWAVDPTIDVVMGSISNLNARQLTYFGIVAQKLDPRIIAGYHLYRTTEPWSFFDFQPFLALTAGRRRWHTEGGWHTAPSTVRYGPFNLFRKTVQFTNEQVAQFMQMEIPMHELIAEVFCTFQAHDGPPGSTDFDGFFGAWDWYWNPKPVSKVIGS